MLCPTLNLLFFSSKVCAVLWLKCSLHINVVFPPHFELFFGIMVKIHSNQQASLWFSLGTV